MTRPQDPAGSGGGPARKPPAPDRQGNAPHPATTVGPAANRPGAALRGLHPKRPAARHCPASTKRSVNSGCAIKSGARGGVCHDNRIQHAAAQTFQKSRGLRLAQAQLARDIGGAQGRQRARQQIGRHRGDHPDVQLAKAAGMAGVGLQLHRLGQDTIGPVQHAAPPRGSSRKSRGLRSISAVPRMASSSLICMDRGGLADIDQRPPHARSCASRPRRESNEVGAG